ncbi:hypothetical protein ACFWYW_58540 [Nonomuraea sp. NPDC059023]|uniref:hypothetical protein n=1 Tax=unclassified Nonomuraea TaxID=2593643 RepID=UPI0036AFC7CA
MGSFGSDKKRKPNCQAIFARSDGGRDEGCNRSNTFHVIHENQNGRWVKSPTGAWLLPPKDEQKGGSK